MEKIKKSNLPAWIFSFVLFIILVFIFPVNSSAYSIQDFLNDVTIVNDPRMNIAQQEAALMRIKLFLMVQPFDSLSADFYVLLVDLGYEEVMKILESLKSSIPPSLYEKLKQYITDEAGKLRDGKNTAAESSSGGQADSGQTKQETGDDGNSKGQDSGKGSGTSETGTESSSGSQGSQTQTDDDLLTKFGVPSDGNSSEATKQEQDQLQKAEEKKEYTVQELEQIFKEALTLFNSKKYAEALEKFKITYEYRYNLISTTYYLAQIYEMLKEYDESIRLYKETISLIISTAGVNYNFISLLYKKIGILYFLKQDFENSSYYLNRSLEYNVGDGETYYWLGMIAYQQKDFQRALELWKRGSLLGNQQCIDSYKWLLEQVKKTNSTG